MLCDNIRKYRKLNGMSQDELAEKLEVTRQSISLWETGQTQPSLENIVALSKLFNVSTDELLTGIESDLSPVNPSYSRKSRSSKKSIIIVLSVILCISLVFVVYFLLKYYDDGNPSDVEDTNNVSTNDEKNDSTSDGAQSESKDSEESESEQSNPDNNIEKDIYGYLKDFVVRNGTLNGDYCRITKTADNYGGYASEDFSLYYWGDTDTIEFCLHSVIDDTFSINFYLYVPKTYTGEYEYTSSYYYRDTGEPLYEARGTIEANSFTENYPLKCTKYIGSAEEQNDFMEMSREGICDLITCLEKFIEVEKINYSFEDFGFTSF